MCEFCLEHGEGQKWYLNLRNYSADLLSDLNRRRLVATFNREFIGKGHANLTRLERVFTRAKPPPAFVKDQVERAQKPAHFGQVLPIEDVRRVLDIAGTIVRLPCGCRFVASGREERCCLGISVGRPVMLDLLDLDFFGAPDVSRFEALDPESAMRLVSGYECRGLIHSVWTFGTPFIGGLCNCDLENCLAMRSKYGLGLPTMFRAEYVAVIEEDRCAGCGECEKLCPVGAIGTTDGRWGVDPEQCYGCGVCRSACANDSIALKGRSEVPEASRVW